MSQWVNICNINDILPATGVCALLGNEQVAIFRPRHDEQVYAISNIDPFFEASDGRCMEDESFSVKHYDVRVKDGEVQLKG